MSPARLWLAQSRATYRGLALSALELARAQTAALGRTSDPRARAVHSRLVRQYLERSRADAAEARRLGSHLP